MFIGTKVGVLKAYPDAVIPTRATEESVGWDLYAYIPQDERSVGWIGDPDSLIGPGMTVLVSTGIILDIPYGWEAQIRPRSGMSLKTELVIPNSPGTIDPDYAQELKVILRNTGSRFYPVSHGDRIAQVVFQRVPPVFLEEVTSLSRDPESLERNGGFGHTGK